MHELSTKVRAADGVGGKSQCAGLGKLGTNRRAVCICGQGRSAALQILAIARAIAAVCALQPIPIRSAHFPLD